MVGKVLAAAGDRDAEIEVIRVLKGDSKPGRKVRMRCWNAAEIIGDTRLFLDPSRTLGPRYETLEVRLEDEVRWLIRRPPVKDTATAIRLSRGYAAASRKQGVRYLEELESFPARQILEATGNIRKLKGDWHYELGCLVDVLLLQESDAGFAWIRAEVNRWVAVRSVAVDWAKIPFAESPRGTLLAALLGACGETWSPMFNWSGRKRGEAQGKLLAEVRKVVLAALPDLALAAMADATYALTWSGSATADEVRAALPKGSNGNGLALGLLWLGNRHNRVFRRDSARAAFEGALKVATVKELRECLRKRVADLK